MSNHAGMNSGTSSKRPCRLPDAARPDVPRRTSSIISSKHSRQRPNKEDLLQLHRQSCQFFSSLNGTVAQSRESSVTDTWVFSSSSGRETLPYRQSQADSYTSSTFSSFFASATSIEESPLGYTLARKRTSMPRTDNPRVSQSASLARSSYQSSFLSAFPEPPTSPMPPLPSISTAGHQRSKSNYRIFPQPPSPPPTPPLPLSRPPIVTTDSYASHPHIEQAISAQDPSKISSISWTSPATRQAEYAKIDLAQCSRRKILRMLAPRWLCGSLGGEREEFFNDRVSDTRSVRRFRIDKQAADDSKSTKPEHKFHESIDSGYMTSSTSNLLDEKMGAVMRNIRTKGVDKKTKKYVRCF